MPGCANLYTETHIVKRQWGFDGFIACDYTAVAETRACPPRIPNTGPCGHGTVANDPQAGANALMAGTDSEMVSRGMVIARHPGEFTANGRDLVAFKVAWGPSRPSL